MYKFPDLIADSDAASVPIPRTTLPLYPPEDLSPVRKQTQHLSDIDIRDSLCTPMHMYAEIIPGHVFDLRQVSFDTV